MNEPNRRFFSGDTLHQALVQAANYHNLQPELIAYRVLEKRHGFLKNPRKVVIEVDPDAPRRESPVAPPRSERVLPPPPPASFLRREPRPAEAPAPEPAGPPRELQPPRESPPPREPRPPRESRGDRGPERGRGPRREGDRGPRRGGDRPGGNRQGGQGRPGGDRPRRRGERSDRPRSFEPRGERPAAFARPSGEAGLVELPAIPRSKSDRYPPAEGPLAEAAGRSIGILLRIAGLELTPRVFQGEERLEIDLSGADVDWCFADDGEFLMAVEHLLPRMIRSLVGEALLVRVDCDNFHEIREERLRSLAQRVADEVRRAGQTRVLEPMNPADRRIIHTTLADDPAVVTESEGDGYFKRIAVRPA